jgi:hypothetical protein
MQTLSEKIDRIVTELGDSKDDVLALLGDLWLEIDYTNAESIKSGSGRMVAAAEATTAFQKASEALAAKLKEFVPQPVASQPAAPPTPVDRQYFADKQKITLQTSWTYRRPFGFVLRGKPYPWKKTWIDVYQQLLTISRDSDPTLFDTLPDRSEFISSQGNPYISRDRSALRIPIKLTETVFVESNLNANLIRDNIARVLNVFQIKESDIAIHLRQ